MMITRPDSLTTSGTESIGYSPQALQIRLDTTELLEQIEQFLRGKMFISKWNEKTQRTEVEEIAQGMPLANKEGIKNIMFFVSTKINRAIVQANIKDHARHMQLISEMYEGFNDDVIINLKHWGIKEETCFFLVRTVMEMVELFLTRPISDLERFSLSQSSRTERVERHHRKPTLQFPGFPGGKNNDIN